VPTIITLILAWLAPVFIFLEVAQLLVADRFLGVEQIRAGVHPLEKSPQGSTILSVMWLVGIVSGYIYQLSLLFNRPTNLPGLLLIAVTIAGFGFRRACGLKWALMVMTFEGALRLGFLAYVFVAYIIQPGARFWRVPNFSLF